MIVSSGDVGVIDVHKADFNDIDVVKSMKRGGHRVLWRRKGGHDWQEDDILWSIGTDYRVILKEKKKGEEDETKSKR